ncbi:MAG TPA: hypothetical protein VFL12_13315 [Thermoanaerobaculia bacterium]|nr:hypothetical protein [Thermoanaerobaculia bacterium]
MRTAGRAAATAFLGLLSGGIAWGGFPSTDVFLPSVGRVAGQGGAEFFTTIWVTDLTAAPATFTFEFLKAGQANPSPASFSDTLQPGQTKEYENVVETKLGLGNALGAARITSTGEVLVAERIFNQPPGADLGDTQGLFFAGVPATFAISLGQSASIQGVNQGSSENFRYNFALVETTGASAQVNVQIFDGSGIQLGQKTFPLQAFEQIQPNVTDVVPNFSSTNARITATVTGGSGHVLLAGAQVANVSQDSSGFEMSFRDDLLGGGGSPGVTSLNGLTGAVEIAAGSNVTITPSGNTLTIASSGSGGTGGLTSITHNATLSGGGTGASPLGVSVPLLLGSSNSAAIQVTGIFSGAGANRVFSATLSGTPSGEGAAIYGEVASGTGGDNNFYALQAVVHENKDAVNAHAESGTAVDATSQTGRAVDGSTGGTIAIDGRTSSTANGAAGVFGQDGTGSASQPDQPSAGVRGETASSIGVFGLAASGNGVTGSSNSGFGMTGISLTNQGIIGKTFSDANDRAGVAGADGSILGFSDLSGIASAGVRGESETHLGVAGLSGGEAGVLGMDTSTAANTAGVFGIGGNGGTGISNVLAAGVRGDSKTSIGVLGISNAFAVIGTLGTTGVQGELGTFRESHNFAVYSFGNVKFTGTMTATGTKSFVEPHPTDATKEIRFVCLEGPESGTYFRGRGRFQGGIAAIDVPESFRSVTDAEGLTVVATPVGGPAVVWVAKLGLDRIVLQASSDVEFHYVVNGVRKAYRDFQAIGENESFVPDGPDDPRFALYAPEIQRRLVATGIYNADGTVNLETAKRLGWDKRWGTSER